MFGLDALIFDAIVFDVAICSQNEIFILTLEVKHDSFTRRIYGILEISQTIFKKIFN